MTRVLDNLDLKLFASELAEPIFVESTDNPVTHARSEVAEPPLPQPPAAVLTVEDAVDNIIGATNNDDDREYEFDKIVSHYNMRNERGKMERRYRVRFTNFGPADDMDYWESDLRKTANDAVDACDTTMTRFCRGRCCVSAAGPAGAAAGCTAPLVSASLSSLSSPSAAAPPALSRFVVWVQPYEAKLANKTKKATTKRTNVDDDDYSESRRDKTRRAQKRRQHK